MKKYLLLAILALPLAALAEDREWIPYKKLIETTKLDKFYAVPAAERDKLKLYVMLTPVNKSIAAADVRLNVVHAGGKQALPLDDKGRALVVPNQQWLAEDAKIWINQPKGEKMGIGFSLDAVVPESTQWRYAALMGSVPQSNSVIGKVAGAFSLFVPTMKMVTLKFAQPAQLTIQTKGGEKRYASDGKHTIRLKLDEALLNENPLMTVSARPLEAELEGE